MFDHNFSLSKIFLLSGIAKTDEVCVECEPHRAVSSAVEHRLHTAGVTGSNPVSRTRFHEKAARGLLFYCLPAGLRLPCAIATGSNKPLCANVDLYSGLVLKLLAIPEDLFTPLFATARVAGWCAHRIEEAISGRRLIRPAYRSAVQRRPCTPMEERP